MARDAIARQFDVDKNSVTLTCEPGKGGYRPGLITFYAKKGKSIDLDKIRESIAATRLSGGTNMGMDYLEITARGEIAVSDKEVLLKVSGTDQQFVLGNDPGKKGHLERLRQALKQGQKVTSITGRVQGWNGRFPDALRALAKTAAAQGPMVLLVTEFEIGKE
jgi:hypothetical protein